MRRVFPAALLLSCTVAWLVGSCGPGGLRWGFPGSLGRPPAAVVSIGTESFPESPLEVEQATEVIWENHDQVAHTVTADSGEFDSGELQPGQSFSHDFDERGTFTYHCALHPNEHSTISVREAVITLPGPIGTATPTPSPSPSPSPTPSTTVFVPTVGGIFQ